jgi:hypothetical protein
LFPTRIGFPGKPAWTLIGVTTPASALDTQNVSPVLRTANGAGGSGMSVRIFPSGVTRVTVEASKLATHSTAEFPSIPVGAVPTGIGLPTKGAAGAVAPGCPRAAARVVVWPCRPGLAPAEVSTTTAAAIAAAHSTTTTGTPTRQLRRRPRGSATVRVPSASLLNTSVAASRDPEPPLDGCVEELSLRDVPGAVELELVTPSASRAAATSSAHVE